MSSNNPIMEAASKMFADAMLSRFPKNNNTREIWANKFYEMHPERNEMSRNYAVDEINRFRQYKNLPLINNDFIPIVKSSAPSQVPVQNPVANTPIQTPPAIPKPVVTATAPVAVAPQPALAPKPAAKQAPPQGSIDANKYAQWMVDIGFDPKNKSNYYNYYIGSNSNVKQEINNHVDAAYAYADKVLANEKQPYGMGALAGRYYRQNITGKPNEYNIISEFIKPNILGAQPKNPLIPEKASTILPVPTRSLQRFIDPNVPPSSLTAEDYANYSESLPSNRSARQNYIHQFNVMSPQNRLVLIDTFRKAPQSMFKESSYIPKEEERIAKIENLRTVARHENISGRTESEKPQLSKKEQESTSAMRRIQNIIAQMGNRGTRLLPFNDVNNTAQSIANSPYMLASLLESQHNVHVPLGRPRDITGNVLRHFSPEQYDPYEYPGEL
jgi:hypothetical protein